MAREDLVDHYLADALSEVLFQQPGPTRMWLLLTSLPEDLRVGEEEARRVMEGDSRFSPCSSRWDLAHRQGLAERPLGGALEDILTAYGRPMRLPLLVAQFCLSRPGSPPEIEEFLARLLRNDRDLRQTDGLVYLNRWLAHTAAEDDTGRLFLNDLDHDEAFLALYTRLQKPSVKGRNPADTARKVLALAGRSLDNRALGLVVYHHHQERFEGVELLATMLGDDRFLVLSGPRWILAEQQPSILRAINRAEKPPAEPAPVDVMTLTRGPSGQQPKLDETVWTAVTGLAHAARTPVSLAELLADVVRLRPRQRNFGPAAHALTTLLNNDLAVVRVGDGRYLAQAGIPEWVRTVPPVLLPVRVPLAPGERSVDVLLKPDQLSSDLAERVRDPYYEDQGDDEVLAANQPVEEITLPILYHHYLCGTMKLRKQDRRFYDLAGPINCLTFFTPEGPAFPVWINFDTGLIYGLLTWFQDHLPPCGAQLRLRRRDEAGFRYDLLYEGETDSGTYIGRERFAQLLALRERLRRRRPFLLEIVRELLDQAEHGLQFDQLWAQANLIRRCTRLQLASALSRPGHFQHESGRWRVA